MADSNELALDILGLPFGEDRQGQWFDSSTDIGLDVGDSVPCFYIHGFRERAARAVARIGRAFYKGVGTLGGRSGHVFRAVLDGGVSIARKIHEDTLTGQVRVSSDSMAHLVRPHGIVGKAGTVTSWPISGMSLMDASTYESAINPFAIAVLAAKAGQAVVRSATDVSGWSTAKARQRQAVIDAMVSAAVKAFEARQEREALIPVIDAAIAEQMPALMRRVQREREWAVGLRDTCGR